MANKKTETKGTNKKTATNNAEKQMTPKDENIQMSIPCMQAIDILIQAAEIGQKAGAYSLQDANLISQAVNILTPYRFKPEPDSKPDTNEGKAAN